MKAFITGGSGFIGRHLIKKLLREKWEVRVLLHQKEIPFPGRCEVIEGDITQIHTFADALRGTDTVFHLAAALGAALLSRSLFFQINAQGTQNVLEAAGRASVKRVLHFSSAGVLGAVRKEETADEHYPLRPLNAYDKSKLEGEQIALRFAQRGMNVTIVRPGWVYGPEDRRTFKLIKAIAGNKFILVTKGTAWQTPVFVDDLIQGVLLCSEKGKPGEVYHIAGKEILTVRQIVETIASAAGTSVPGFTLPLFPVKVAAWKMDKAFRLFKKEAPLTPGKLAFFTHPKPLSSQKAMDELGYSPESDFLSGMTKTIHWYQQHHWL
jgi:nucleoside-diphosphate-sugar epimerase